MALALCALVPFPVNAQQGGVTRYVYDNNGRLRAVISPAGEAAIYDYDPAGNFTAIRRLTANDLEIIEFTPREGAIGAQVTIFGVGFAGTVSNVSFNGTTAQILSQTPTSVLVSVPSGATTGPISVTSPRGTRTTVDPFTVKGVQVIPSSVTVSSGRTLQFTANVAGLVDPTVVWSVNSFVGGNTAVGTITQDGLYTAPEVANGPAAQFVVRATSSFEPMLFGEAQVTVPSQGGGYEFLSPRVSVRYGAPQNIAPAYFPTTAVSVRYGAPPNSPPAYIAGPLVSVRYGTPPNSPPAYIAGPLVSVRYGTPPNSPPAYLAGSLVSVRYGTPPNQVSAPLDARVSVTKGPMISSISPATIAKGAAVTITVNGINLAGADNIKFINSDGSIETKITASNINVDANGATITTSVTVDATTTTGRRIVLITTTAGRTLLSDVSSNTIEIVP